MRRPLAWLFSGLLLIALASPSADAHTRLSNSSPSADEQIATSPAVVELTFTDGLADLGTAVVVTGPDGEVQAGTPTVSGRTVRQPVQLGAPAGDYTVSWRVVAQDGHPVTGSFTFHSAAPGSAAPGSDSPVPGDPEQQSPQGRPSGTRWAWWLLLGLTGAATVGALAAQRVRQRR